MGGELNIPLSQDSSVCNAGKENYSCGGCLSQEVFSGCFNGARVVVLGYEWEDGYSVEFKAYSR